MDESKMAAPTEILFCLKTILLLIDPRNLYENFINRSNPGYNESHPN